MLRSNPSADIEVSGKGDAEASLFFLHQCPGINRFTLSGNLKAVNLRGPGTGPRQRIRTLQFFNMNGITCGQATTDSIEFSVAVLLVAEVLSPF